MLVRTRWAWSGCVVSVTLAALSACSSDESGPVSGSGGSSAATGGKAGQTSTGGSSSGAGGSANGGSANSGSANGGSANGGSANGGSASGGSASGGSASGGSASGGSANGGAGGVTANGGNANGGSANTGGTAGLTSSGGSDANAGAGGADGGVGGEAGSASGGTDATGGAGLGGEAGAGGAASCGVSQAFEPEAATVYVMVDRSGSMFDCLSTTAGAEPSCPDPADTAWTRLKTATLSVIQERQAQVRFGFAAFTGTNVLNGGTCPILNRLEPKVNNYADIKTLYDALPFPPVSVASGQKFETPTRQSLDLIGAALLADPAPGKKYILLVTDGQPDYCDDGNTLCAPDSVIAGLQGLRAQGITTLVMGIQSAQFDLPASTLKAFATAGAGENTVAPLRPTDTDTLAIYDQCSSSPGWSADLVKSGKTAARGVTLGSYSATSGPALPYTPSVSDPSSLTAQLGTALSSVKSCSIDLASVYGRPTEVAAGKVNLGTIQVNGGAIAYNATSGWSLPTPDVVQLNGAACTAFRTPTGRVTLDFPCDALIFQ